MHNTKGLSHRNVTTIVSRGDWLGKPANIKVENNIVLQVMKLPDHAHSFVFCSQIVTE